MHTPTSNNLHPGEDTLPALAEPVQVVVAAWLVFAFPVLGGIPLLLAALPRLVWRRPLKITRQSAWLGVFMLSAVVGLCSAYDTGPAWTRFWLLLAGVILYQSLAGQPRENLSRLALLLGLISSLLAGYFLLTHNWTTAPADIGWVNRIAVGWMRIRPRLDWGWLHPNQVGGIIAVFAPVQLWGLIRALKRGYRRRALTLLGAGGFSALGLLFTSSRAAWLALASALAGWLVFEIDAAASAHTRRWLRAGLLAALALAGIIMVSGGQGAIQAAASLAGSLPGPDSSVSRLEIYANTLRLVADAPFTGGGLGAFSAHYSEYILLLPVVFFTYAHNLYLDLAFNLGLPGLAVFLIILMAAFRRVLAGPAHPLAGLRGALFAGLLVMSLHGLVDDAFLGHSPTPFLFVLPGIAAALPAPPARAALPARRLRTALIAATGVVLILLAVWQRGPLLASLELNRGTLSMARAGLPGFPTAGWDETSDPAKYATAQGHFEQALAHDPGSTGAHYRLGLIAMQRRDFATACRSLEAALALDPSHRGVVKALGYCRTWSGDPETAVRLLAHIPEARREMGAYKTWWLEQGRPDLAAKAAQMQVQLTHNP